MVGFLTCCCTSGRWSCNGRWWAAFVLARHLGASLHEPRRSRSGSLDHRIVCPPFLGWKLQSFLGADLDNSHGQACPELSIDAPPPDYKVLSRPGNAGDVERAGCSGIGPALPLQISPRTVSSEPNSSVGAPSTNNHASGSPGRSSSSPRGSAWGQAGGQLHFHELSCANQLGRIQGDSTSHSEVCAVPESDSASTCAARVCRPPAPDRCRRGEKPGGSMGRDCHRLASYANPRAPARLVREWLVKHVETSAARFTSTPRLQGRDCGLVIHNP